MSAVTVPHDTNAVALVVFVVLFALVSGVGFAASRWRRAESMAHLDEWGLGGRKFGTWVTWFLLGGDLYTAYTFIAVPALVFGAGAAGFFALPYTIIVYPLVFVAVARLWVVSKANGYVTPADFVRGRYGSRGLPLAVAFTGLLATMPYIALQLLGIEVVLGAMGVDGEWPLIIAFVVLAAYTYSSGLRAPALIAIVKDGLIYLTVIVAIIVILPKVGGLGGVFDAAREVLPTRDTPGAVVPGTAAAQVGYATLALGSALALFLYPHSVTGVLSAGSARTVRRNAALLPAYSFVLGLIALLGFMAIAAGIVPAAGDNNYAVPDLFLNFFPDWFVGVAFAAIGIGALVPAAVMSIAAANLWTRNVHKAYIRPEATPAEEARVAKLVSLLVKVGAVLVIIFVPTEYAIDLQLLGGVWILQTLPSIVVGLYTRWLHQVPLLVGWAVGMVLGSALVISNDYSSSIPVGDVTIYAGLLAVAANLVVSIGGTILSRTLGHVDTGDETRPADYDEAVAA